MPQTSADRNPDHLWPQFAAKVELAMAEANTWAKVHRPDCQFKIIEGLRSASYQHSLYMQGRDGNPGPIVTERDGYNRPSNHQSGCAVDVALCDAHDVLWNDSLAFAYMGHCYREQGLKWGGDWTHLHDLPHGEWPETDIAAYKSARQWLKDEGLA